MAGRVRQAPAAPMLSCRRDSASYSGVGRSPQIPDHEPSRAAGRAGGVVLALSPSRGWDEAGSRGCLFPRQALVVPNVLVLMGEGAKILPISEAHKRTDANSHRERALLAQPLRASVSLPLP